MPSSIPAPIRTLHHTDLSRSSFAAFGTVIENPSPDSTAILSEPSHRSSSPFEGSSESESHGGIAESFGRPSSSALTSPLSSTDPQAVSVPPAGPASTSPSSLTQQTSTPRAVSVNQNTALKYLAISPFTNRYDQSPSQTPATITMNLFACFPRILTEDAESLVFKTRILERHPFTAQTFIPMGLAAADHSTKYLVIVAPTLGSTSALPDRGPPDLANLRAFMAHGGQAVTYAAGTWHAPMVVVGMNRVDFVVAQFCNGVPAEDCEEMELEGDGFGVVVELPSCTP